MIKQNKWPSKKQWLQFFRVLGKKEKIFFSAVLIFFITSLLICLHSFYINNTVLVPADYGHIKEGLIGQPQLINPLYASVSETDKDIIELLFSGLMKYNSQGEIVPDLINEYKVENNGKDIIFSIKENVKWHDDKQLTIDDVIFTIDLVQKTEYSSPLRTNWLGVKIEKMSEYSALLTLRQTYTGFKESLVNLKIMPKHIWENKTFQAMTSNVQLNIFHPIGSGPYKIEKVNQNSDKTIRSIVLQKNNNYYNDPAHISKIEFFFFNNENALKKALEKGTINSASIDGYSEAKIIEMPSYYNLFLNNQKKPLDDKEIRQALTLLTTRELKSPFLSSFYNLLEPENALLFNEEEGIKLLEKNGYTLQEGVRIKKIEKSSGFQFSKTLQLGSNNAEVRKLQECLSDDPEIYPSGTISGYFGQETKNAVVLFQEKYKDDILVPNNLTKGNGIVKASTIKKLNEVCFIVPEETIQMSFVLKTTTHPKLVELAEKIKEQWGGYGIQVEIKTYDDSSIKKIITDRDFDVLLFGVQLGGMLEPTPFYHSSQRVDPGLNLSLYQNTDADKIIEKIRTLEGEERLSALSELESIIIKDAPVIPLYQVNYYYIINKKIKNFTIEKIVEPSKRFVEINKWYVKEKRIWK
ncbi:MAG: ABC transporter substrate-binding protein [Candidatus Paceibacterota bacterium]|jgi:peptide/nickel transport system substrate-binding protein